MAASITRLLGRESDVVPTLASSDVSIADGRILQQFQIEALRAMARAGAGEHARAGARFPTPVRTKASSLRTSRRLIRPGSLLTNRRATARTPSSEDRGSMCRRVFRSRSGVSRLWFRLQPVLFKRINSIAILADDSNSGSDGNFWQGQADFASGDENLGAAGVTTNRKDDGQSRRLGSNRAR